jgi:hypothetical protein
MASLLTYPFLALFFLCATMARLLFAPAGAWRHQALLLVRDGLFFALAAGLYWCVAKLTLFPHDAASIASVPVAYRASLSLSGAIAKLGSFSTDVLGRVLALWFLYPSRVLSGAIELVVGIGLLVYLWRGSRETDPPPVATRVVTAVGILALLLAVNSLYLLTAAFFLYRIFFGFAGMIVLLLFWGSAQIGVHRGISHLLGVRNGPAWAAIGICGIACSVTCIDTTRNALNSYLEFAFVKAQIAASPDRTTLERIHVVQPRSWDFGFNGYPAETDEFNRPTTNYTFDIANLVRQALVEMKAQPKYIVDGREWVNRADGHAGRIEPITSGRLRIFRHDGSSAEAGIQGNRIQSPDSRFNGTVTPDLKAIRWSDGSIWGRSENLDRQKRAPESTGDMDAALAGPWASLDGYGADQMLVTWSEPGAPVIRSPKMLVIDMNALLDSALGWPDAPGVPKPVSVSPSSGNTATARFQAIVTIPEGFATIASIELLFRAPGNMATYCDVKYDRVGNQFWIVNAGKWAGPSNYGTGTPLSNSQCSLNVTAATARGSGNALTVTFPVTFTTSFSGAKEIAMYAVSTTGQYSGYQIKGTWTVPGNPSEPSGAGRSGAGTPFASSVQSGFKIADLTDGTPAPWGSTESPEDTYAGLEFPDARAVRGVHITVFTPGNRPHLRDISVVTADAVSAKPAWRVVRSRLQGSPSFSTKVTVPPVADQAVVVLEIDPADPGAGPHKVWGIACFSRSLGYIRNYLPVGNGIYLRELQMQ